MPVTCRSVVCGRVREHPGRRRRSNCRKPQTLRCLGESGSRRRALDAGTRRQAGYGRRGFRSTGYGVVGRSRVREPKRSTTPRRRCRSGCGRAVATGAASLLIRQTTPRRFVRTPPWPTCRRDRRGHAASRLVPSRADMATLQSDLLLTVCSRSTACFRRAACPEWFPCAHVPRCSWNRGTDGARSRGRSEANRQNALVIRGAMTGIEPAYSAGEVFSMRLHIVLRVSRSVPHQRT